MGDITKNLSRHEFVCKCGCGFDTVDYHLALTLQDIVDHYKEAYRSRVIIKITGGNRCKEHNDKLRRLYDKTNGEKGAKTASQSQHIYGRAADFKLYFGEERRQIWPSKVYAYIDLRYTTSVALGSYLNRCHIDTRSNAGQRW